MRVHGRMPVILATDPARRLIELGPLPAELLGALRGGGDAGMGRRRRREEQPDRAACGDGRADAGIIRLEGLASVRSSRKNSIYSIDIIRMIGGWIDWKER
jgi:hypothetical protein